MVNESLNSSFLEEIAESKRSVEQWPQWMLDGTSVLVNVVPEMVLSGRTIADLGVRSDGFQLTEF